MGISFIPGPDQAINAAIDNLATGIDKFLNPNKQLQIAVRNAAATNPELLQKMADMESANPGALTNLGLGPVADIIAAVKPSAAGLAEQAVRPGAAKTAVEQQTATGAAARRTTAVANLDADKVKAAARIMAADPSITFDAALQTLTGQTQAQRDVASAQAPVVKAQAEQTMAQIKRARNLPDDLTKVNWTQEARDFLDGREGMGLAVTAYYGNEDTRLAFNSALQGEMNRRSLEAQKVARAQARGETVDNFRLNTAFREYQRSDSAGTLDSWMRLLYDPDAQQRARALMEGTVKPENQEDIDLLASAKAQKLDFDTSKLSEITRVNSIIASQINKINTVPDKDIPPLIDGLNQALAKRSAMGGKKIQAKYEDRTWPMSNRVVYIDENGKRIDPATVNAIIADPYAQDIQQAQAAAKPSKIVQGAYDMINKPGIDVIAALHDFKIQDPSPNKADSKALEQLLYQKGLIKRVGGGNP